MHGPMLVLNIDFKFTDFYSALAFIFLNNFDLDQIIPARSTNLPT